MLRCLSLLGMMVFTLGVIALASAAPTPAPQALPPSNDDNPGANRHRGPRFATLPALAFHVRFSVN
jgi:hypothetical protein